VSGGLEEWINDEATMSDIFRWIVIKINQSSNDVFFKGAIKDAGTGALSVRKIRFFASYIRGCAGAFTGSGVV